MKIFVTKVVFLEILGNFGRIWTKVGFLRVLGTKVVFLRVLERTPSYYPHMTLSTDYFSDFQQETATELRRKSTSIPSQTRAIRLIPRVQSQTSQQAMAGIETAAMVRTAEKATVKARARDIPTVNGKTPQRRNRVNGRAMDSASQLEMIKPACAVNTARTTAQVEARKENGLDAQYAGAQPTLPRSIAVHPEKEKVISRAAPVHRATHRAQAAARSQSAVDPTDGHPRPLQRTGAPIHRTLIDSTPTIRPNIEQD